MMYCNLSAFVSLKRLSPNSATDNRRWSRFARDVCSFPSSETSTDEREASSTDELPGEL